VPKKTASKPAATPAAAAPKSKTKKAAAAPATVLGAEVQPQKKGAKKM